MNNRLTKTFTQAEVEAALKQMAPLKLPRPNGYGASFYQTHWHQLGEEVSKVVLSILNENNFDSTLNCTYIALIPKVQSPKHTAEFKPISLCNVFYKIVVKVSLNRLNEILSEIISPSQSAFIPSKLITDNIMVTYEVLHTMKTSQEGSKGGMAIKLDMSKAYDRIEQDFLEAVMDKLGFRRKWKQLIM